MLMHVKHIFVVQNFFFTVIHREKEYLSPTILQKIYLVISRKKNLKCKICISALKTTHLSQKNNYTICSILKNRRSQLQRRYRDVKYSAVQIKSVDF